MMSITNLMCSIMIGIMGVFMFITNQPLMGFIDVSVALANFIIFLKYKWKKQ